MLEKRLAVGRSGIIAAIRAHLEATFTNMIHEGVPREATAYLHHLRAQVLAKAARLA